MTEFISQMENVFWYFNVSCPAALAEANADWANVINIGKWKPILFMFFQII